MFENVNNELYFIYGLIVLVIILIAIVLIIDRKDTKRHKRRIKLTDTLNMKPITDDTLRDSKYQDDIDVVDIIDRNLDNPEFVDTMEIPQIKLDLKEVGLLEEEEIYHDTELEKTQAQIRVEEITKALEEAKVDEKIEEEKDKYQDYEEEQERNAIISYEQLKNNYDKLYEESEKKQYLDDNTIPINIKELYELTDNKDKYEQEFSESKEEDIEVLDTDSPSTFKRSPYISPVYGIQGRSNLLDKDIENGSKFLNTLKELRDNLQ